MFAMLTRRASLSINELVVCFEVVSSSRSACSEP